MVAVISYFLGNICGSYIFGKLFRQKDIRNHGSGNAGATNALRVFGVKIALLAFLCDFIKGMIAVYLGKYIVGTDLGVYISAIAVAVGHNYPILLRFKGGKGIATSFGILIIVCPLIALSSVVVFVSVVYITRYVSLGSVISAIAVPISGLIIYRPFDKQFFIFTLIIGLMAIFRHIGNIKRLLNGTERKLGQKAKS
ncbi:glycerol-3-phosphate 1-O-acyltransferase PlsY [Clostridiaceae bacterium M8S5]|nr:glycerol-3-phosphate 1-O-acyltransferase PlsY [Clostridiaceae bacterium M8S5]